MHCTRLHCIALEARKVCAVRCVSPAPLLVVNLLSAFAGGARRGIGMSASYVLFVLNLSKSLSLSFSQLSLLACSLAICPERKTILESEPARREAIIHGGRLKIASKIH